MSAFEAAITCSGGQAGGLEVWDLRTGSHLRSVAVPNATGRVLALDERHVVLVQRDRPGLQVWAWKAGRQVARTPLPEHAEAVAVSGDRRLLAVGGRSGSLHLWQLPEGRLLRSWRAHYKAVTAVAFTADGASLVSAGADAVVCVWDAAEAADESAPDVVARAEWTEHSLPVTGLAVGLGRAPRAVTVSADRTLRVWDVAGGAQVASFVLPASLHAVALAPDESAAYCAGGDGRVFAVDLASPGAPVAALAGHAQRCVSLSLSLDGSLLLSCGSDGQARLWDVRAGQTVRTLAKRWPQLHGGLVVRDARGLYGDDAPARDTLPALQRRPAPAPALGLAAVRVRPPAEAARSSKRRRLVAVAAAEGQGVLFGGGDADVDDDDDDDDDEKEQGELKRLRKELRMWQGKCAQLLKLQTAGGGKGRKKKKKGKSEGVNKS